MKEAPRNAADLSGSAASRASRASRSDPTGDTVAARHDSGNVLAVLGYRRPSWQADALCREYRHLAWHPVRGQHPTPALEVCGACSVRPECLAWAMADQTLDIAGVLGGMTANARIAARRL